ncbi:putative vegetative incompatibility protein 4 [Phaeomoniella chlamydospora]|uniref:protein-ribulosamine 3-kinase n=1 Tax=Phaeomoniella chlamydospora TaxID=158046 RepID=A0A0G2H8R6_PHACM|nr:putative vegetative incompatibility protein 4 [Phaeomoniella chlamydospora]
MLEGEFTGMTELYKLMPNFVPRPLSWGALKLSSPETYFFLVEFKHFNNELPDAAKLGAQVGELHKRSVSPTGMFGFGMPTYDGAKRQEIGWDPSWASMFAKLLKNAYEQDVKTNGIWKELEDVFDRTVSHLIPRLLGVLQDGQRTIKPCLIHGDMWEGNIGTDIENGDPWIFDCAAYYAHNEMEVGIWTAERHKLKAKAYKREYLRHIEPSEPEEEWEDRNRLYRTKTNFAYSADVPGSKPRQE